MSAPVITRPAFCAVPAYERTLGPEVADLSRLADYLPDPEQELILDALFALRPDGRSAAFETCVICSRQNIKTGVAKMAAMGWLMLTRERLVVWSAHEFRTAQEAFRDLEELLCGSDVLRRQVAKVSRADGDEAIITTSGSRLIFKTRTKGGGRGLTGDKVILDEGFALRPMHMGALLPTLSARPDPQVMYCSSAGLAESAVLRGIRDRGRAATDPGLAYLEWCAPPPARACAAGAACTHALTAEGCGCDDPGNWQESNPAMGRRITAEYIAGERRALPPAEFARERMGWWDDPAEGLSPLDAGLWAQRADPASQPSGRVAIGFAICPDLSSAAVAAGGRRADGLGHGELTDHRPGTAWLPGRLAELAERWDPWVTVLNASGQAVAVLKELNERGFEAVSPGREPAPGKRRLWVLGAREYAQSCGALVRDVVTGGWRHMGQRPLDDAAAGARTRPLEDAYAWSHKNSLADICPLEAVTAARHGFAAFGVSDTPAPFALWG